MSEQARAAVEPLTIREQKCTIIVRRRKVPPRDVIAITDTSLYYLQSRYYDPVVGRFINGDDPAFAVIGNGNLFAYCGNEPVVRIENMGLQQ